MHRFLTIRYNVVKYQTKGIIVNSNPNIISSSSVNIGELVETVLSRNAVSVHRAIANIKKLLKTENQQQKLNKQIKMCKQYIYNLSCSYKMVMMYHKDYGDHDTDYLAIGTDIDDQYPKARLLNMFRFEVGEYYSKLKQLRYQESYLRSEIAEWLYEECKRALNTELSLSQRLKQSLLQEAINQIRKQNKTL